MASSENHGRRDRRVSYVQLQAMCELLNSHKEIAKGFNKSAKARDHSRKIWEMAAQTLNSLGALGEGATKDWKGWSSYWVDYKAKLKKKLLAIRNSQSEAGGTPTDSKDLDEVQIKFLRILGHDFGVNLPPLEVDPFYDTINSNADITCSNETNDAESSAQVQSLELLLTVPVAASAAESADPDPPIRENQLIELRELIEVSEPVVTKSMDAAAAILTSPEPAVPRRRVAYSQKKARRLLVESCRARTEYARERANTLTGILGALLRIAESLEGMASVLRNERGA